MKLLLTSLILCTFLISCGSSNKYLKEYRDKNYSCDQIDKERIKLVDELHQSIGKQAVGDKISDCFAYTYLFLLEAGVAFMMPINAQGSYLFTGLNQKKLRDKYKALEDLAIEKNCPSKALILKRRQMIERNLNTDRRIDSR